MLPQSSASQTSTYTIGLKRPYCVSVYVCVCMCMYVCVFVCVMELPFTKFELVFIFIAFTVFSMFSIALVCQFHRSEEPDLNEQFLKAHLKSLRRRKKQKEITITTACPLIQLP
ncbi:hypothetical protein AALO_G00002230 [Alosa alosa]|uniref:Uncharacterized protein n=1 Tax=Alosa alosa TaxID=278164 RepID=A0AAV6HGG1_9TELE|nr:hypothetical protein AALO_G00002230 [Alosa alosa]